MGERAESIPGRSAPLRVLLALVPLFLLLAACDVRVELEVDIDRDGSGSLLLAMGFDGAALDRLGDPETALRTEDLEAVGWEIDYSDVDDEGFVWVTGERSFESIDELSAVLGEVAGPGGPLQDPSLTEVEDTEEIVRTFSVTVDLSDGLESFSDPDLEESLGGEPFGGIDEAVAEAEGRPIEDMFDIAVTWIFDGETVELFPTLGDGPETVEITTVEEKPANNMSVWPVLAGAGLAAAVVLGVFARMRQSR